MVCHLIIIICLRSTLKRYNLIENSVFAFPFLTVIKSPGSCRYVVILFFLLVVSYFLSRKCCLIEFILQFFFSNIEFTFFLYYTCSILCSINSRKAFKMESIRKLSNQWTKILYQKNLKYIAFFFILFKSYRRN